MRHILYGVALLGSLQQISATFRNAPAFECPSTSQDTCEETQVSGWDWSGLEIGSFSSYSQFSFSGFSCASSFGVGSKRDLAARTSGFQNKCITGKASSSHESSPSVSCDTSDKVDKFSIDHLQVSVEFDVDLEFHYYMNDGSTCKQKSSCSTGGTTVQNALTCFPTQCGGATNVTVVLANPSSEQDSCSIGIHSVGFKCATTTTEGSATISTASAIATSPAKESAIATGDNSPLQASAAISITRNAPLVSPTVLFSGIVTAPAIAFSPATLKPTALSNLPAYSVPSNSSPSVVPAAIAVTGTVQSDGSSPSFKNVPPNAVAASSSAVYMTTIEVDTTTTICPVTLTSTSAGIVALLTTSTISTQYITNTKTYCSACASTSLMTSPQQQATAPPGSPTTIMPPSSALPLPAVGSSSPAIPVNYPEILPSCMNTWLQSANCTSNTSPDCYCPSTTYTNQVYECLAARAANASTIFSAQAYFQGICANYITSNPSIVTEGMPSVDTSSSNTTSSPEMDIPAGPETTLTVQLTTTVPCTNAAGSTIPSSSTVSTTHIIKTVPQVAFTTITATRSAATGGVEETPVADLVPGVAASVSGSKPSDVVATMSVSKVAGVAGTGTATGGLAFFTGGAARMGVGMGVGVGVVGVVLGL